MTTSLSLSDFVKRVVAAFLDIIHGKDESSDNVQIKAGGEYAQIGAIGYNAQIGAIGNYATIGTGGEGIPLDAILRRSRLTG